MYEEFGSYLKRRALERLRREEAGMIITRDFCCDEYIRLFSECNDVGLAVYDPKKESMSYTTFGKKYLSGFKFCPYCKKSLEW